MKIFGLILFVIFLFTGCVKVELGNVVSDSVDASKQLYQTLKRKSNGEEERKYTHTVLSSDEKLDIENIEKCNKQVKQIITNSGYKITEVLSESSEIKQANDTRSIQCNLTVLVKK